MIWNPHSTFGEKNTHRDISVLELRNGTRTLIKKRPVTPAQAIPVIQRTMSCVQLRLRLASPMDIFFCFSQSRLTGRVLSITPPSPGLKMLAACTLALCNICVELPAVAGSDLCKSYTNHCQENGVGHC